MGKVMRRPGYLGDLEDTWFGNFSGRGRARGKSRRIAGKGPTTAEHKQRCLKCCKGNSNRGIHSCLNVNKCRANAKYWCQDYSKNKCKSCCKKNTRRKVKRCLAKNDCKKGHKKHCDRAKYKALPKR